jgi:hypothetical protein
LTAGTIPTGFVARLAIFAVARSFNPGRSGAVLGRPWMLSHPFTNESLDFIHGGTATCQEVPSEGAQPGGPLRELGLYFLGTKSAMDGGCARCAQLDEVVEESEVVEVVTARPWHLAFSEPDQRDLRPLELDTSRDPHGVGR